MNLSMVSALSTLRFAGHKPATTPLAFSALAPTRADVFFASTLRFGSFPHTLKTNAKSVEGASIIADPNNENLFHIKIGNNTGTIEYDSKKYDPKITSVSVSPTKEGAYGVVTKTTLADEKTVSFVTTSNGAHDVAGVKVTLQGQPNGLDTPEKKLALNVSLAKAETHVFPTTPPQTLVTKGYMPNVGIGERLDYLLKAAGGVYKPELTLVPGETITNKLIQHYAAYGIKEFFIPVHESRLQAFKVAWANFKPLHRELTGVTVNFSPETQKTGTAGPLVEMLRQGVIKQNEPLFVAMGDHALQPGLDVGKLITNFDKKKADGALIGVQVPEAVYPSYGVFTIDKQGHVGKFYEKPPEEVVQKELHNVPAGVNTAIMVLGPKSLAKLVETKEKIDKKMIDSVDGGIDFSKHLWEPNANLNDGDEGKLTVQGMTQPQSTWVDVGNVGVLMQTIRRIANGDLYGVKETKAARKTVGKNNEIYYNDCKALVDSNKLKYVAKGNTMVVVN
ncbi:MAG: sugar phosphate nucleotidyltransferase [Vampirovibrionales bacterium]|nr:sugar phosphate nucleotidyltransferase [Vampirovibrionales bacterium]